MGVKLRPSSQEENSELKAFEIRVLSIFEPQWKEVTRR
jgi:hypothetical protein